MQITIAQVNPLIGNISHNTNLINQAIKSAYLKHNSQNNLENNLEKYHLIIFPELVLTGYPPDDLLYNPLWPEQINDSLNNIQKICAQYNTHAIIGHPHWIKINNNNNTCTNSASLISPDHHKIIAIKTNLPNYGVFDEKRYFTSDKDIPEAYKQNDNTFIINNKKFGVLICEDGWSINKANVLANKNIDLFIQLNASPFEINKTKIRHQHAINIINKTSTPLISVQTIGGQDELIFDGGSFVINKDKQIKLLSPYFKSDISTYDFNKLIHDNNYIIKNNNNYQINNNQDLQNQYLYEALILGCQDYFKKNNIQAGAIIGLSGGIDSALTIALATKALGKENITAILMPSKYTSKLSLECALAQIKTLGINYKNISIEPIIKSLSNSLFESIKIYPKSEELTMQNLQARARSIILMAESNLSGKLVLTTGNKSELAMGYSTLYGDMSGAFNLIKDLYKTQVYSLSKWINKKYNQQIIPEKVINRAPSAELAPNQTDQDSLPPYEILDKILIEIIENNKSINQLKKLGYSDDLLNKIISKLKFSEYKRKQSPLGIKVSKRSFGKEWRYPIVM